MEIHRVVLPAGARSVPKLVDLGPAQPFDTAVHEWRTELKAFREAYRANKVSPAYEAAAELTVKKMGRELDRLLIDPLRLYLGTADSRLLLVPDGALHLIPFAALVDPDDKYLIETRSCGYLSSGRDLLRPAAAQGQGVEVFAGPDFDLAPTDRWEAVRKLRVDRPAATALRGPAGGPTRQSWKELDGALAEASDVAMALGAGRFGTVRQAVGKDAPRGTAQGCKVAAHSASCHPRLLFPIQGLG